MRNLHGLRWRWCGDTWDQRSPGWLRVLSLDSLIPLFPSSFYHLYFIFGSSSYMNCLVYTRFLIDLPKSGNSRAQPGRPVQGVNDSQDRSRAYPRTVVSSKSRGVGA